MAFLVVSFSQAQNVYIPDVIFKYALVDTNCVDTDDDGIYDSDVDTNNDGEIQVLEAEAVLDLKIYAIPANNVQGIEAFVNLKRLSCNETLITNLNVTELSDLEYLDCSNNQLNYLNVSELSDLEYLDCSNNQLNYLDVIDLANLITLNCTDNQLITLDLSNLSNLITLSSNNNSINTLVIDGLVNVEEINLYGNNLSSLDVTELINLTQLNCYGNQINTLNVSGLTSLETLLIESNQLTTLDLSGLSNLKILDCDYNDLNSLDLSGLTNLVKFSCDNNEINSLDFNGLVNVDYIDCRSNQLNTLNVNGLLNLGFLNCENNQLNTLDVSDLASLATLECSFNQLTTLNINGLTDLVILDCSVNELTTLFIKNGQENILNFAGNPNLEYICVDESELDNVQYLVDQEGVANCVVNSYCSFVPGGDYFTIQGENKLDIDANGCNTNDPIFPSLKYNITDGSVAGTSISNASGNYFIPVQASSHTITPIIENPTYFTVSPSSLVVNFPTEASPYNQNFCVVPNGTHNDLEITILPIDQARPGFDTNYKIIYKNKGNTELSGSVDLMFQGNVMDMTSANPIADSQILNELSWNFSNLLPFESREIVFTMNLNTPTDTPPLNGDDVLIFTATVNPVSGDEMPDDNEFILNQTVVNSFDPNDKTCLEGKVITPEQVGAFVHYMIRFENTGTADALNIVVKDDIDLTKYDVSSLIPLNGSHEFVTRIKEDNIVEFIFENINLPFDDATNDGYVLFKIKTLESLTLGDTFSNDAEIYFDYNAPIITNDELTTVAENLSIEESILQTVVKIYPNPVSGNLTIDSKHILETISIFDVNGRQLQTLVLCGNTNKSKVNLSRFSKGVYFVKIRTEAGIQTSKIIKE
ncbi:hypothetical protein GCM10010976_26940 [Bizionia arctica]|uniref:T9SS type A sorting domain-containing protein n=2 Tax=Bizionia arctica TaxID=1495645 RepID=A0A917GRN9_9FLAO|nr:hypothetical protein GCM10010976_26940 [Bizionia arctica]